MTGLLSALRGAPCSLTGASDVLVCCKKCCCPCLPHAPECSRRYAFLCNNVSQWAKVSEPRLCVHNVLGSMMTP